MTQPLERVCRLVSDVFGIPLKDVGEESSPQSIAAWDSFQQLNLVLALEQEFDMRLEPEEIHGLTDVRSIVTLVRSKTRSGQP